jgi:hypothetical protein
MRRKYFSEAIFMKSLTLSLALGTAVVATFAFNKDAPARALSIGDIPNEEIPSWLDLDRYALAYYDYRLTPGLIGQYTTFEAGSQSLFDETQSGIESVSGLTWIAGQGYVSNEVGSVPTATYTWKNVRVPTNQKNFKQAIDFIGGVKILGITVTTDDPKDVIEFPTFVFLEPQNILVINATIKPQPNTVTVKVSFTDKLPPNNLLFASTPIVIEQGYILDQCTPIPEPSSTLGFLALGTLGAASILKRKLKSSKFLEMETTKVS